MSKNQDLGLFARQAMDFNSSSEETSARTVMEQVFKWLGVPNKIIDKAKKDECFDIYWFQDLYPEFQINIEIGEVADFSWTDYFERPSKILQIQSYRELFPEEDEYNALFFRTKGHTIYVLHNCNNYSSDLNACLQLNIKGQSLIVCRAKDFCDVYKERTGGLDAKGF